jgi:putative acetyltransferase
MLIIRPESKDDLTKITQINNTAFGQPKEGQLVKNLRKNKQFIPQLSLVAILDNELVGHILFFPIKIISKEREFDSAALAPIAVLPKHQRSGVGSALVNHGLAECRNERFQSLIVLGHPDYYPRFGFKPASRWNISAPFDVPDEAFMALELTENRLKNVQGVVHYPEEFNAV